LRGERQLGGLNGAVPPRRAGGSKTNKKKAKSKPAPSTQRSHWAVRYDISRQTRLVVARRLCSESRVVACVGPGRFVLGTAGRPRASRRLSFGHVNLVEEEIDMRRMNIFSLAMGLFAAATTYAQAPKPAGSVSQVLALENAMDKKDSKADRRPAKPADPPDIDINCNLQTGSNRSINAVLAKLDPHRAWTLEVSGTCNENVTVQSFENLTLIAKPGAAINDPSGGNLDVLDVGDTHEFNLQGFTINGGSSGVVCFDYSLCRFSGNTIQGAAGDGLAVVRSQASLQGDTLQNNAGRGLAATNSGVALGIGITTPVSYTHLTLPTICSV